jgi:GGDEF domain-containing protein
LDAELARSRRYQKNFSIIMLEPANTIYEHPGDGDRKELNLSIAKLLFQTCRTDVDIPFTGHHFGVILPETGADGAAVFAKRLLMNSAKKAMLDLRISTASFPVDGVTSEELISACEVALKEAIASEQTIVRSDKIHESEKLEAISSGDLESYPSEIIVEKAGTTFKSIGLDEYLLTIPGFNNLADLPFIQENLKDIKEIEDVNLLEYTEGRLVFKLKSRSNLSDKQFVELFRNRLLSSWKNKNLKEG